MEPFGICQAGGVVVAAMVMGGAGTGRDAVGEGEVAELLLVEHLQGPRRVAGTGRGGST